MEYDFHAQQTAQRVNTLRARNDLRLPKEFKTEFERLAKLELLLLTLRKDAPDEEALVDSTVRTLEVDMKALGDLELYEAKVRIADRAVTTQRENIGGLIQQYGLDVLDEIRAKLFTPALERLKALSAKVSPDQVPADLLRAGQSDVAHEMIACEVLLDKLREAYSLRDLLFGSVAQGIDQAGGYAYRYHSDKLGEFKRPDIVAGVWKQDRGALGNMLAVIEAGGEIWLPHPQEVAAWRPAYHEQAHARANAR